MKPLLINETTFLQFLPLAHSVIEHVQRFVDVRTYTLFVSVTLNRSHTVQGHLAQICMAIITGAVQEHLGLFFSLTVDI